MGATLTGVPFYREKGYVELEAVDVALGDGLTLPIVRMGKVLRSEVRGRIVEVKPSPPGVPGE
jgi:hypothetical protein